MSAKDFASIAVSWATVAGILIGGGYSALEYNFNLNDQKIERVFEYISQFRKAPVYNSRQNVHEIWNETEKDWVKFVNAIEKQKSLTDTEIEKKVDQYLFKIINDRMGWDVQLLSKFYDEIAICVNNKLCHRQTAYDFFGQEMVSFINSNYTYLISLRKTYDPNFAQDLFEFKKAYVKAKPKSTTSNQGQNI
jgi:hypothetical protein